ncbi:MAG: hypothetical protein ACYC8T_38800, partial [Myxococcaceae bacterium]
MASAPVKRGDGFQAAPAKKAAPAAPAKPVAPPMTEETPRDLANEKQRIDLATTTSQVNDVSVLAGNQNDVCAGAALVNAMVLNSATPDAASANAAALRKAADRYGGWSALPPSVDKDQVKSALDHFAAGKASEVDLHYLQQLAYATGRAFDPDEKRDPELNPGLNAGQVGGLATQLKSDGALLGDDSRFVQLKGVDDTSGHWVVQSGKVIANSLESVPVDATKLSPASAVWDSDVHVKKGDANVETRLRRGKGLA